MKISKKQKPSIISNSFIDSICDRLRENKQVRRNLPLWGRLHIDRQLPFLCVYRKPVGGSDQGANRLVVTSPSYLLAPSHRSMHQSLSKLICEIAKIMVDQFGSFIVLEIWSGTDGTGGSADLDKENAFHIFRPRRSKLDSTVEAMLASLKKIRIPNLAMSLKVATRITTKTHPSKFHPLMTNKEAEQIGCHLLGLEVPPVYRDMESDLEFPDVLIRLRRELQRSLKKTFFEFTRTQTTRRPPNFQSLGRRAVVKAVWEVDQKLAKVSNSFDFLLLMTPVNTETQWAKFNRRKYSVPPKFIYRPLPIDPALLKRKLFSCPIERVEDPTLALLFTQMQRELDRKLSMLADRGTRQCLYGSLQVFGGVGDELYNTAENLLKKLPARTREGFSKGTVNASEFAAIANQEIQRYRDIYPDLAARVEVRRDVTGLMVSRGNLLVGSDLKLAMPRVRPLIQHEVGTHILTFYNGLAQPFKTLLLGLPGYEELQEGLAVLSEYLVGGLNKARLRLLAARVLAVKQMIDGASFIDVFNILAKVWRFEKRTAFVITMRVFRGGGLTKDAVYLAGLIKLLAFLMKSGNLDELYIGKVDITHIPIIRELLARQVLKPAPLKPFYLSEDATRQKLGRLALGPMLLT